MDNHKVGRFSSNIILVGPASEKMQQFD